MADNIIWGYARVSSTSQNLDRQLDALRAMGIEERYIHSEKKSGKDFERPAFLSLVGTDTLIRKTDKGTSTIPLSAIIHMR